ncbi:uncharacterized protein LOC142765094 [Rhipicephalus microplus]|uniref:uncharacterized protein LOC142765094 n=1 Tax=Rhipicephalus microplus TaxID=6941 RepID=UPI003F6BC5A5
MATSEPRQTEAVQYGTDEKWVLLQHDGKAATKQESSQDGDLLSWSAEDTDKFLSWCRSAWNDVLIRETHWDNIRSYALGVALFGSTVLHLLTALASLAEGDALRVLLTSLGHFTTAVLRASVFFYATRFISLLAAEARAVKKAAVNLLLLGLLVTNFVIFVAACAAIRDEMETGRKLLQEELRQGDFVWHLKTLATMVMLKTSIVLKLLSQCQLTSMLANVYATCRTFVLHWRETKDAGILVIWRLLKKLFLALSHLFNAALFFAVIFPAFRCIVCVLFSIVLDPKALLGRAAFAASAAN